MSGRSPGEVLARAVEADGDCSGSCPHPSLDLLATHPVPCPSAQPGPSLGFQRDLAFLNPARLVGLGSQMLVVGFVPQGGSSSTVCAHVSMRVRVCACICQHTWVLPEGRAGIQETAWVYGQLYI